MKCFFSMCTLVLSLCLGASAYTNVLENGTSQTVTNEWNLPGTNIWVGNLTASNTLEIASGGMVTNLNTIIGGSTNAFFNDVSVSGSNAVLYSQGNVVVGESGSSNTLSVSNGGSVDVLNVIIGSDTTANANTVVVDGGGSVLTVQSSVVVGLSGSNNQLEILNGGVVSNFNGYVGNLAGASNNNVLVSGDGSAWINSGTVFLGNVGVSNNWITVTNEGLVSAGELVVYQNNAFHLGRDGELEITGAKFDAGQSGFNWNDGGRLTVHGQLFGLAETNLNDATATVYDGNDKMLTLTGDNAVWNHGGNDLVIGLDGAGNQLVVTNGARVLNANAFVGYNGNSNRVSVAGSNSLWNSSGTLTVGSSNNTGNAVSVADGGTIRAENLVVNSGGSLDLNEDGTLSITGDFDASDPLAQFNWNGGGTFSIGGDLSGIDGIYGTNQLLVIDGGTWETNGNLTIGLNGFDNSLAIQNGGMVSNVNVQVGVSSSANDNAVLVSGSDSQWISAGLLKVGETNNTGNSVTVTNHGTIEVEGLKVADDNDFNLDQDGTLKVSGDFNAAQSGFNWGNDSTLIAEGHLDGLNAINGSGKSLVLNGATLTNALNEFTIGGSLSGNSVVATNGGGIFVDTLRLGFAANGNANTLVIGEDGLVTNEVAYVGFDGQALQNSVLVSGENATWLNGALFVGNRATNGIGDILVNSGNSVTVTNGGWVQSGTLVVEEGNDFNLNSGGTLRMTGDFNVSAPEHENLNWNEGGNLSVGGILTGITNLSNARILTLDGSGAEWSEAAGTNMLVDGAATLNVTNDAIVRAGNLEVSESDTSVNVASNSWFLVSDGASTNALPAGGMMVASTNGTTVLVDNHGLLDVSETLRIGLDNSTTGTVSVQDFGTVKAGELVIADANSAFNLDADGTLAITGDFNASMGGFNWTSGGLLSVGGDLLNLNQLDGTNLSLAINGGTWDIGGDLYVGQNNSGNLLEILNGGLVTNANGYIGFETNAFNNAVVVSGSNSVWNNSGDLHVGYDGSSNSLTIADGGTVLNVDGYVGSQTNASGNTVLVDGGNAQWINLGSLTVGNVASNTFNKVTVQNGGLVQANSLTIYTNDSFNLSNGGTLDMQGDFDAALYGFNWTSGGRLMISGANLSGMPTTNLTYGSITNPAVVLNGGRDLVLNNSTWTNAGMDLVVGYQSSNSDLLITNGATVANADGYIGWGTSAKNNQVLVSGTNSTWNNSGNLYVGAWWNASSNLVNAGTGNSLVVSNSGLVVVGEAATNLVGVGVASSNHAQLVVGNGTLRAEDGLFVGVDSNLTGTVDIRNGGTAYLNSLAIAEGSAFNLSGALIFEGDFDASTAGFNWLTDGDLVVTNGNLLGISGFGGTNQTLTLQNAAWDTGTNLLVVGINGSGNTLTIESNSQLASTGAWIGSGPAAIGNTVDLNGSNVVWNNSDDLVVGYNSSGNTLRIQNGATNIVSVDAFIGWGTNGSNNTVSVSGSNSLFDVSNDLWVGYGGSGNKLEVNNSGLVSVDGNLAVSNSTLNLASGGAVDVGGDATLYNASIAGTGSILFNTNAVLDNTLSISGTNTMIDVGIVFDAGDGSGDKVVVSDWTFTVSTNTAGQYLGFESLQVDSGGVLSGVGVLDAFVNGVELNGATIAPDNGELEIDGELNVTGLSTLDVTVGLSRTDRLIINNAGDFALSNLNAKVTVQDNLVNPLSLDRVILSSANSMTGSFNQVEFIEEYLLFNFNTVLTNGNEVKVVAEVQPDAELGSSLRYAGSEGIRAGFGNMKNTVFTRTKQLRRNLVATAHSMSQEAYLMSNTNAPSGAEGPGDQNTIFDMHVWMDFFSGQGDYDRIGKSDGFSLNNSGTTIGADRLFGDSLTAGLNYTYARSDARTPKRDRVDTETYWLGAYGEWVGQSGLYVDSLLAFGWSEYDTLRVEDGYRGSATYDGQNIGTYVDVGQYFYYKNLALSPYAGLHLLSTWADEHTETSQGGVGIKVDETERMWLESAIGLKARHRFDTRAGRFQVTGYGEWMHDFIEDDIDSTVSFGDVAVGTARITPDQDTINVGVGLSWISTDYMETGIGYNGRFSENYEEHNGSIFVDVRF